MTTTKFKNGQWIIAKWEDGDIDFAKFQTYFEKNEFVASQFYRFQQDGKIETLSNKEGCDLTNCRYEENWRLATKKEINKYIKLCGGKIQFNKTKLPLTSRVLAKLAFASHKC